MKAAPSARELLFGPMHERLPYTGKGALVAFFDSSVATRIRFMGSRLKAFHGGEEKLELNEHIVKGLSVCAGEIRGGARARRSFGLAPAAKVVSTDFRSVARFGYADRIREIAAIHGRVHISGHPYSRIEERDFLLEGRAHFRQFASLGGEIEHLVVAAAGHDGALRVRYPAVCESVLAVGVCRSDGRRIDYSGRVDADSKPEILVPSERLAAIGMDGKATTFSGTSAAVSAVCGVAALWSEKFALESRRPPAALVLKAAILASSERNPHAPGRILSPAEALGSRRPAYAAFKTQGEPGRHMLRFRLPERGLYRIAALAGLADSGRFWLPRLPEVAITGKIGGRAAISSSGEHWSVVEFNGAAGEHVELQIRAGAGASGVAIVGAGLLLAPEFESFEPDRKRALPRKPLTILGISASHEASACVMQDGVVKRAIQLERLTRLKRDGVPHLHSRLAADYCLDALGLKAKDVDAFAFNIQPLVPEYFGLSQPTHSASFDLFDPFSDRALFVSHHLAHACSAFLGSPFSKAAVFVADGSGGSTVGSDDLVLSGEELRRYLSLSLVKSRPQLHVQSTYSFDEKGYRLLERETAPSFNVRCGSSSLGETYAAVSNFVFGSWHASGKLMGLAPYGSADSCGASFLEKDSSGRLNFRADWKNNFRGDDGSVDPMLWRDLAARIQADLETALIQRFSRVLSVTGCDRIAYAGGIALNSVVNARVRSELPVKELFVFPASSDAGISIGAAAAAHFRITGGTRRAPYRNDFLGQASGTRDIEAALRALQSEITVEARSPVEIASMLADGAVVGLFEGGSEFGPRALGHRSILADPRSRDMWTFVNRSVKFREDFRPFAPVVPLEDASRYFEVHGALPYMLEVVRVRSQYRKRLGAVTHVDGSARVQTVDKNELPYLHSLLKAFGRKTGIPVLLNTSLNVRGGPIVETPLQALEMMLATHLSGIVLDGRFVRPRGASMRQTGLDSKIALVPGVEVRRYATSRGVRAEMSSKHQGPNFLEIENWAFELLVKADGTKTIRQLMAGCQAPLPLEREIVEWLRAIDDLKYIMRVE